jgi:adenylate cyclase
MKGQKAAMASEENEQSEEVNQIWRAYLTKGETPEFQHMPWYRTKKIVALYRRLPSNPRCRVCQLPFKGFGGVVMRHALGVVPSRLNPQICNDCERFAERFNGGAEVELSILFADVRGSTRLAETMSSADFSRLINRFYNAVTRVLFSTNAMVEKLIGDAVTGFYTPGIAGAEHARIAVEAARAILRLTGHAHSGGPWIPVGIGVHTGVAYVGAVTTDAGGADIAVLGDTPNIGARLASLAKTGEIVISQATAQAAGLDPAGVEIRHPTLKGRSEPVEVWVI